MKFTVLGSGTGQPHAHRGPAGFLVNVDAFTLLIDGGSGTLQKLARLGIDPVALSAGFYTHWHPDHCADLVPLLFAMHGVPGRDNDYPIYAGLGFSDFFDCLKATYGHWIEPRAGQVQIHELSLEHTTSRTLGPLTLTTAPANHMTGSLHVGLQTETAKVVFSGDTGPSDALISLSQNADLLVCECAGLESAPIPGHMRPSDLRVLVREARPRALWVTHLYDEHIEAELHEALDDIIEHWHRPSDLTTWSYSHSIVAGGLDEMS